MMISLHGLCTHVYLFYWSYPHYLLSLQEYNFVMLFKLKIVFFSLTSVLQALPSLLILILSFTFLSMNSHFMIYKPIFENILDSTLACPTTT